MAHGFYSSGWSRAPDIRQGALITMVADGLNDPAVISTTRPTGIIPTMSMRGMRIRALGDEDDDVLDMVVFAVDVDNDLNPTIYTTTELGTCIFITGASGLANPQHPVWNPLGGTEFFADTVTSWTGTNAGNALFSYANGSAITASPVADSQVEIAELMLPDVGNVYGILLRFELGEAGAAGAMFKLDI